MNKPTKKEIKEAKEFIDRNHDFSPIVSPRMDRIFNTLRIALSLIDREMGTREQKNAIGMMMKDGAASRQQLVNKFKELGIKGEGEECPPKE